MGTYKQSASDHLLEFAPSWVYVCMYRALVRSQMLREQRQVSINHEYLENGPF